MRWQEFDYVGLVHAALEQKPRELASKLRQQMTEEHASPTFLAARRHLLAVSDYC